jgi:hypothetical protein
MNARNLTRLTTAVAVVATFAAASPSFGFRMIQVSGTGRYTSGTLVSCDDYNGFTHRSSGTFSWYLNTANQGAGKDNNITPAMDAWNNVSGTPYFNNYAGTTTSGFATDGRNTMLWASGNGCTGSCLALTALVVQSGQLIVESDITYNNDVAWKTDLTDYDVQTVATHELGHSMGIHHSELTSADPRPTMVANYFGTHGRTLEADDRAAVQCSKDWYVWPIWEGQHEITNCREIKGWAWNARRPNSPMLVQIRNGSSPLMNAGAFECRADLAGKGNTCHGFREQTQGGAFTPIRDGKYHTVNVANYRTGALLAGTGQSIICQVGIFRNETPTEFNDHAGQTWTVGNEFSSSMNGQIHYLRYYKAAEETGTHTLSLYTASGTFLSSVNVNFGSGYQGWVTGTLPWPYVNITAGTRYVVTVTTTTKQSKTPCGFSSPITNGPMTGHGGRYIQGTGFPTTGSCSNFWTDAMFDQ